MNIQLSEQDYLELQESATAFAQFKKIDEDYALKLVDEFLTKPNSTNSLFIWEVLQEDDLGLVAQNFVLQEFIKIAEVEFKQSENNPLFH